VTGVLKALEGEPRLRRWHKWVAARRKRAAAEGTAAAADKVAAAEGSPLAHTPGAARSDKVVALAPVRHSVAGRGGRSRSVEGNLESAQDHTQVAHPPVSGLRTGAAAAAVVAPGGWRDEAVAPLHLETLRPVGSRVLVAAALPNG
jgi:hypothetical protein